MSDLRQRVGLRVRQLRESKGLTQDQLAEKCGLSQDTIGNIERGQRAPLT
jgi:transcriptional regulator with XRE-family HTH domain